MPLTDMAARAVANKLPKVIDAKTHAFFDYGTAATCFALGAMFWSRNKRASIGAMLCGSAIVATSMITDYPGGVKKMLTFQTHGKVDAGLAGLTAAIPNFLAFSNEEEAKYFRGLALAETVIAGLTDFDSARSKVIEMPSRSADWTSAEAY